jgi:hypothetical protein
VVPERVIIEELGMRFPWLEPEDARRVAVGVAERVGRGLAEAIPLRRVGSLDVRVPMPTGASPERLIEVIAQAILEGIARC